MAREQSLYFMIQPCLFSLYPLCLLCLAYYVTGYGSETRLSREVKGHGVWKFALAF